jgi:Nucleotidyltransferase/DNA polymerase involved in DNA repair
MWIWTAFFAAIEVADNKSLKGKPVIVGGTGERGVVSTANYEARAYGVHSAIPIYMARAKCPNGIFLPVRYGRYKEVSDKILNILYEVTPLIEPLSIDEAYLDITAAKDDPINIANFIKRRVMEETELTISIGLGFNKFLAKLASDWNKPNGFKIIRREDIPRIFFPLPINKVYGLGQKSVLRLNNIGIFTIEDLYKLSKEFMIEYLGKFGIEIYERIRGIDNREVEVSRERKSIGRETTFRKDTNNKDELKLYLKEFAEDIVITMGVNGLKGRTVTVKTKTEFFAGHTKSRTLPRYIFSKEDIYNEACDILDELELKEKIRLIGLSVSSFIEDGVEQLTFL